MGLDWNPGPRAKPGLEDEFTELWTKLHSKPCFFRERKVKRFDEITLSPFQTLNAPIVGRDPAADQWAKEQYPNRVDKTLTEGQWLAQFQGFYVLPLLPKCDGLPRYTNGSPGGYVEQYSFRGQFLKDCTDIIGNDLLNSAWDSKLPAATRAYGQALLECARRYAAKETITAEAAAASEDPDSKEFHLDVVQSAGRWCVYWADRGHWLEAYF